MDVKKRLQELGVELPTVSGPFGSYVPAKRVGDLVLVAGQLPIADGTVTAYGMVGNTATLPEAQAAARLCVVNALAAVEGVIDGGVSVLTGVAKVVVFVQGEGHFVDHSAVANGASEFLLEVFGEAGKHARAAVGVSGLPKDSAVEVEITFTAA